MDHRKESGANMVEMALMLPVALVLIYGLIYYSYALVIDGIAEDAAHQALDIATTNVKIEKIPDVIPENCGKSASGNYTEGSPEESFCPAIYTIKQTAENLATSRLLGKSYSDNTFAYINTKNVEPVRVKIPPRTNSVNENISSELAYKEVPIIVELDYAIRPIFPGLNPITRTVRAVAYYEMQSTLSYPVPVDCAGIPYGHDDYDAKACDCASQGKGFNEGSGLCVDCATRDGRLGQLPYIEGHPEYGQKPEGYVANRYGCWCPSRSYCNETYNGGNKGFYASDTWCGCTCWSTEGFNSIGGDKQNGCECSSISATTLTGTGGTIELKPEKVLGGEECSCEKKESSVAGVGASGPLTSADCRALHQKEDNSIDTAPISVDASGCKCGCNYNYGGCPGEQRIIGGVPDCKCECVAWVSGRLVVDNNKDGSDPNCGCHRIKGTDSDTCDSVPCSGENLGGAICQPKKYSSSCDCECDLDYDCGSNAILDETTCACTCTTNGTYTGPNSCPNPNNSNPEDLE